MHKLWNVFSVTVLKMWMGQPTLPPETILDVIYYKLTKFEYIYTKLWLNVIYF